MFDARKLLDMLVQSGSGGASGLGQIGAVVGQVLNQATAGMSQAAGQIDAATGASQRASDMVTQSTGRTPSDFIAQAKDLAARNQLATGAALGGLAAVLLGTEGGRKLTAGAAKMGGLALIGGLAYKAFQNYQAGKPLLDLQDAASGPTPAALPAPADEQGHALRLVRAMIAAASADGIVDATERAAIAGNLKAAGLDQEAAAFLEQEFANPADLATLAAGIATPEEAAQVYAAARLAIDPDRQEEKDFLAALATTLRIEPGLVAHIDAAAQSAKV
ncbi:MAG: DUF533 domain-containing protein [Hyphomicrobiales bacterium]|uniref:tellurite resistance TerB family protein n=1 Tax=Rhabdaerophilum calidifontis TaxID=2604328 RepID=UPI001FE8961D|nr:DUF533 domain-containing protein [Rhabdaerophilum calidifontis]MCA1999786.1 DUF533 domain-containing protein [Hyphomicrobiales bacterium]